MSIPEEDQQPHDGVSVTAAARELGITPGRILGWLKARTLVPLKGRGPRGGRVVSLAAARRLVRDAALSTARAEGFVPPFEARRLTGLPRGRLASWMKSGKVATIPGPYGQLVRLADVQEQGDTGRGTDAGSETRM